MLIDQFGLMGMLGAGYEHDSRPTTTSNNTIFYGSKGNGFYSGLTPGVVFFPIPRFSLGASIGGLTYSRLSQRSDQPSTGDNYENVLSNFGLSQLLFSGTYYFGR